MYGMRKYWKEGVVWEAVLVFLLIVVVPKLYSWGYIAAMTAFGLSLLLFFVVVLSALYFWINWDNPLI